MNCLLLRVAADPQHEAQEGSVVLHEDRGREEALGQRSDHRGRIRRTLAPSFSLEGACAASGRRAPSAPPRSRGSSGSCG